MRRLSFVYESPMADANDEDDETVTLDACDDPKVADAISP
jgi:hypothetical protein